MICAAPKPFQTLLWIVLDLRRSEVHSAEFALGFADSAGSNFLEQLDGLLFTFLNSITAEIATSEQPLGRRRFLVRRFTQPHHRFVIVHASQ